MLFAVNNRPAGKMMFESNERRGLTASPIKFKVKDSMQTKVLKTLVSSMISFDPEDRPTIDEVLAELHTIACKSIKCGCNLFLEVTNVYIATTLPLMCVFLCQTRDIM